MINDYTNWALEIINRTKKSQFQLENQPGMFPFEHAFYQAHLTVDEAVEYYIGVDDGTPD